MGISIVVGCDHYLFTLHLWKHSGYIFPAAKKWGLEDSNDILLQPSSLLAKQSWLSSLYYFTLSRLPLSVFYWGAQNCTQYFSLSITRVKQRGIITSLGLRAVLLLILPRVCFLPELSANILKIVWLYRHHSQWDLSDLLSLWACLIF